MHGTALQCNVLYCPSLHCTVLHRNALRRTALHCTALHSALLFTALHCTALLLFTALHCTALHCTALLLSVLVLLSASVERFGVSRMRDFLLVYLGSKVKKKSYTILHNIHPRPFDPYEARGHQGSIDKGRSLVDFV